MGFVESMTDSLGVCFNHSNHFLRDLLNEKEVMVIALSLVLYIGLS